MSKLFKLIGAFTASVFLLLSITTSVSAEKKILFSIKVTKNIHIFSKNALLKLSSTLKNLIWGGVRKS